MLHFALALMPPSCGVAPPPETEPLAACERPERVQGRVATSHRRADEGCAAALPGLETATAKRLDLIDIVEVEGDLVVFNDHGTEHWKLPKLERVSGSVFVQSPWVASLEAPRLEGVGGSVGVAGRDRLTAVKLPRLRTIAFGLRVTDNDALGVLEVSSLADVGDAVTVVDNDVLERIDLPRIERVRRSLVIDGWACDAEAIGRLWSREADLRIIASGEVCPPPEASD
ncbi:MAG: hypothetical protein AAF602_02105 [Myxococcota bacterium]